MSSRTRRRRGIESPTVARVTCGTTSNDWFGSWAAAADVPAARPQVTSESAYRSLSVAGFGMALLGCLRPLPTFGSQPPRLAEDQRPAAAVCGTRDGRAKPSLFSTVKYSFRLDLPNSGSRKSRTVFTESASQMQTARVPSVVGKVWWSLTLGGRLLVGSAAFQNVAGSEIVCCTMTYMGASEK